MERLNNAAKQVRRIEKPSGRIINPSYDPGIAITGRIEFLHLTSMNFALNAINKMRGKRALGHVPSVHAALAEVLGADGVRTDGERAFGIHAANVASADLLGRTLAALAPHTNRSSVDCKSPDGTAWRDDLTNTGLVAERGDPRALDLRADPGPDCPLPDPESAPDQSEEAAAAQDALPEDLIEGWEMGRNATLDAARTALIEAGLAAGLDPAARDFAEVEDILDKARALADQRHPNPLAATGASPRASADEAA